MKRNRVIAVLFLAALGSSCTHSTTATRPQLDGCTPQDLENALAKCSGAPVCLNRTIEAYTKQCADYRERRKAKMKALEAEIARGQRLVRERGYHILPPLPPPPDLPRQNPRFPDVDPPAVNALIRDTRQQLEPVLPDAWLRSIETAVEQLPVDGHASPAPLVYKGSHHQQGYAIDIRATRRDWGFALHGALLLRTALAANEDNALFDLAFWCFLRAAELREEPDHLSNVAWFFNVLRRYNDAMRILALAREWAHDHQDLYGQAAFALRRLDRAEEARGALRTALAQERTVAAGDTGHEASPLNEGPLPPNDQFGAYFETANRHRFAFLALHSEYREALYERLFPAMGLHVHGPLPGTPWPVYHTRRQANEKALDQCLAGIAPALMPCPFGSGIVHPACKNSPDRITARLSQLKHAAAECRCEFSQSEQEYYDFRVLIHDLVDTVREYDREWTPRLERAARFWRSEIAFINATYDHPAYQLPWPDNFQLTLEEHYRLLSQFANQFLPSYLSQLRNRRREVEKVAQRCRITWKQLEAFKEEAFRFKPLRCLDPLMGKEYTIGFGIGKMKLYIGDNGLLATQIEAELGALGGTFSEGPTGGSLKLSAKIKDILKAEAMVGPGGDWGVGGSIGINALDVAAKALPALKQLDKSPTGIHPKSIPGKLLKIEAKYETSRHRVSGAQDRASFKIETGVGITERRIAPPAWIRLGSRAQAKDPWPLRGTPPTMGLGVSPDC